jgi:RNase H-like domain found in reverse transcriptase
MHDPCVSRPGFNKRFFLAPDASTTGIGAMIYQLHDYVACPVAFISHAFNATELNWSIPEKELYALIYSMDKFKPYLFGPQFTWIRDAKCLTWLHRVKDTSPKHLRWCLQVQGIDFSVHHKPGKHNVFRTLLVASCIAQTQMTMAMLLLLSIPLRSQRCWSSTSSRLRTSRLPR